MASDDMCSFEDAKPDDIDLTTQEEVAEKWKEHRTPKCGDCGYHHHDDEPCVKW